MSVRLCGKWTILYIYKEINFKISILLKCYQNTFIEISD